MGKKYDFCGWATKSNLLCSDGRIIDPSAFDECDGKVVPLVWNHQHKEPYNVLGHALLEKRGDDMYSYCSFNDTESGRDAKELVSHGDIVSLSIYANELKHSGNRVMHGTIREVSLVLAGANPGAFIDTISISHSDEPQDEEALIYSGVKLEDYKEEETKEPAPEEKPAEEAKEEPAKSEELEHADKELTVKEAYDAMSPEKKDCLHFILGAFAAGEEDFAEVTPNIEKLKHTFETFTDDEKNLTYALASLVKENMGGKDTMKVNVFDKNANEESMAQSAINMDELVKEAKANGGSLKEAYLAHAVKDDDNNTVTYGMANIDYLFPDARTINNTPDFIKREDAWVTAVINGSHHTPFSRVKSIHANITMDEARARGYVKGTKKVEEVFALLKRTTDPQTVYKLQKLDRDDIIDITDLDVVAFVKGEMRGMLNEEIARAALVGDGRSSVDPYKIGDTHIRPIWTDDDLYTVKKTFEVAASDGDDDVAKKFIRTAIKARKDYKGSGNPVLFTTEDFLADLMLIEDTTGRLIYDSEDKLRSVLRVSRIITVPVMEGLTRSVEDATTHVTTTHTLAGIIVNMKDYNFGADKGGSVSLFDDFDIDYNQQKMLIEARCSGALIKPYSAIVIESIPAPESGD